ncbi:unnamed protein product [Clonostachys rhizophaga]|uniref:CFEM domain-containing protein n=1 Tax=Clonostachys rhizophaga TaxID=160324 RepID=A0A9N9YV98_9HYPO|nr:unnamed protein product [Clonostachys rhizophaga]
MAHSSKLAFWLAVLLVCISIVRAEISVLEALQKVPKCGNTCFVASLTTASCTWETDPTCLCSDSEFHLTAQQCVVQKCNARDSLEVSRIEADACQRPYRSRRNNILYISAVDVPAWFIAWIRLYSRWAYRRFAADDWVMLAVAILYTAFLPLGKYTAYMAFGIDMWFLDYETVTQAFKRVYIVQTFYPTLLGLSKISVLCFYLRIFPEKQFRRLVYIGMALIAIPTIVITFITIFQCKPISLMWEGWLLPYYGGKCFDMHVVTFVAAGFNIAQDLFVVVLPLVPVWHLKMDTRTKWGVMVMLGLGVFITVTSCVRVPYIAAFGRTYNPTWDYEDILMWSGLELSVTIIVACLPAMGALMKQVMPWVSNAASAYGKTDEGKSGGRTRERTFNESRSRQPYFRSKNRDQPGESQEQLGLELGYTAPPGVKTEVRGHRGSSGEILKDEYLVSYSPEPTVEDRIRVDTVTTITTSNYYGR